MSDIETRPEAPARPAEVVVKPRRKSLVREYGEAIIVAVLLALLIRAFVVQAFTIPSGSMMETLQDAVKHRGSSLADEQYVDLFGRPGEFQQFHNVYAREGESCPRCRHVVVREKVSGRSTFYCSACQV